MINTSVSSLEEISTLDVPSPQPPKDHHEDDLFKCDVCDGWRRLHNMYSYDWCKACYKYWLKCKFQGIKYVPWKDKKHLFDY
jgi:hypothetical protein